MINLHNTYTTENGKEVVLYEIIKDQIIGRVKHDDKWHGMQWDTNGQCPNNNLCLKIKPAITIKSVSNTASLTKQVPYYGTLFTVPYETKYMATDKNGNLFAYTGNQPPKPNLDNGCFTVNDDITFIAQLEFEGEWTKSVTNVE